MHDKHDASDGTKAHTAARTADLNQQIVRQDAAIHAIEQRQAVAAGAQDLFSWEALAHELSIEQELAAAQDARGTLLYDRAFVNAPRA